MLVKLNAPLVRLDPDNDVVETEALASDTRTEQLVACQPAGNGIAATGDVQGLETVDFTGERWVTSRNYSSRSGKAVRAEEATSAIPSLMSRMYAVFCSQTQ